MSWSYMDSIQSYDLINKLRLIVWLEECNFDPKYRVTQKNDENLLLT